MTNAKLRNAYVTESRMAELFKAHDVAVAQEFDRRMDQFGGDHAERIATHLVEQSGMVKRQIQYGTLVCVGASATALAVAIVALVVGLLT